MKSKSLCVTIWVWLSAYAGCTLAGDLALQRLVAFGASDDGTQPTSLIRGSDGCLYGTTSGASGTAYQTNGTVFKLTPGGEHTVLASFDPTGSNTCCPRALVQAPDGSFYGAVGRAALDHSAIFHLTPGDEPETIFSFNRNNGSNVRVLVYGADGNLYGTTEGGGGAGYGTIFRLTTAGQLTTLFSFSRTNGINPTSLVRSSDGTLFGTTSDWIGVNAPDTVFKLSPSGQFTTLVSSFDSLILRPWSLIQGTDGFLYGLDMRGGSNEFGSIFRLSTSGTLTVLGEFNGTNGWSPDRLIQGSDGNLYGTTGSGGPDFAGWIPVEDGFDASGSGTIFQLTSAGELTALASFEGMTGNDVLGFLQTEPSVFYGVITSGESGELASVFRLAPRPLVAGLQRETGKDVVTWNAFIGGRYQVEQSENLATGSWAAVTPQVVATSNRMSLTNSVNAPFQCYYRVRLLP